MATGERGQHGLTKRTVGSRSRQSGFSYLLMLFFVAITAAALAALGQRWSTAAQREREAELAFRGGEIARAIQRYVEASPNAQAPEYPRTLEDLLADGRGVKIRFHLRRLYVDPFTMAADWELVPAAGSPGRFAAVRSRSEHALLRTRQDDGSPVRKAKDWAFSAQSLPSSERPPNVPLSAPLSDADHESHPSITH